MRVPCVTTRGEPPGPSRRAEPSMTSDDDTVIFALCPQLSGSAGRGVEKRLPRRDLECSWRCRHAESWRSQRTHPSRQGFSPGIHKLQGAVRAPTLQLRRKGLLLCDLAVMNSWMPG